MSSIIPYPAFPWQGKLELGVLNPSQQFPLMQPYESVAVVLVIRHVTFLALAV